VPLALKVGCPSSGAGCDIAFGLYLHVCWSEGYFLWCYVLLRFPFYWCVFCCFSFVVWCVSAAGGVFACSGVILSSISSTSTKLTYDSDVA
jgi:hypothetical protein